MGSVGESYLALATYPAVIGSTVMGHLLGGKHGAGGIGRDVGLCDMRVVVQHGGNNGGWTKSKLGYYGVRF